MARNNTTNAGTKDIHKENPLALVYDTESVGTAQLPEYFAFATYSHALNTLYRQGRSYIFRFKLDRFLVWNVDDQEGTRQVRRTSNCLQINNLFDMRLENMSILAPLDNFSERFCYIAIDMSNCIRSKKVQELLFRFIREFGDVSEVEGRSLRVPTSFNNYAEQASGLSQGSTLVAIMSKASCGLHAHYIGAGFAEYMNDLGFLLERVYTVKSAGS